MTSEDSTPVISVCVANYNGEDIITDCIESILGQKNAPKFEILVHDDASTDDSLKILAQFESVQVIESAENMGFCISNNRMAAAARGEFILLLNNDARASSIANSSLIDHPKPELLITAYIIV